MIRLLLWRRLRWLALGSVVRYVLRRSAKRSVEQATADLEQRLPTPLRRALEIVPADPVRAGGSAIVAGQAARRMAVGTRRASQEVAMRRRQARDGIRRVRSIGDEIGHEAERARRRLTADYLWATQGPSAADDSLLDIRELDGLGLDRSEDEPLPPVPAPVRPGRWRAARRLRAGSIDRVQRSYRPRSKPWDT